MAFNGDFSKAPNHSRSQVHIWHARTCLSPLMVFFTPTAFPIKCVKMLPDTNGFVFNRIPNKVIKYDCMQYQTDQDSVAIIGRIIQIA